MTGAKWASGLVAALVVACGDGGTGIGDGGVGGDASLVDGGGEVAPPAPPDIAWTAEDGPPIAPPAVPRWDACPDGWRATELEGLSACDPWPAAGPPACDPSSMAIPGATACTLVGSACPADGWPAGLPASGVVYVRPGVIGGDGSRTSPFGTIAQALIGASGGTMIALARGEHAGPPFVLPGGVMLVGACASETIVSTDVADVDVGVIDVGGESTVVRDVTISGPRPGISLSGSGRGLVLEDAIVAGVVRYGVRIVGDHVVRIRRSLLRDIVAPASTGRGGRGAQIESAADVVIEESEVRDVHSAGIASFDPGTQTIVRDVWIHDVLDDPTLDHLGSGVVSGTGGAMTVERTSISAVRYTGAVASNAGTTLTLNDVDVRDVAAGTDGQATGFGLAATDGGTLTASRVTVVRSTASGLRAEDSGTLDVSDTIVSEVRTSSEGAEGRGASARMAGVLRLARVHIAGGREFGVLAIEGSQVTGTDVVVERMQASARANIGVGLRADASTITIERAELRDLFVTGVSVYGTGATVSLTDARVGPVAPVELEGTLASIGVFAEENGSVHLVRVVVAGATENIAGRTGGEIVAEDCLLDSSTSPTSDVVDASSIVVRGGTSVTVRRSRVLSPSVYGISAADTDTRIVLEDVAISLARVAPGVGGYAIGTLGAQLEVTRVALESSGGGAVFVGLGSQAAVRDLRIVRSGVDAEDLYMSVVAHAPGTRLSLERVELAEASGVGVVASGGASIVASDLAIRDVAESACTSCSARAGTALAVSPGSSLEVRGFRIDSAALAGIQVVSDTFVLENGTIARATIGLNLQVDGVDASRFSTLRLEDNVVNVDSRELPVPEPTPIDVPGAGI